MILPQARRVRVVAALWAACAVLVAANLIKHRLLTWESLASRKDALDGASAGFQILAIVVGGFLSYLRYFKGRTLSVRAELDLSISVVRAPNGSFMHCISLTLRNLGTVAIWEPQPTLVIRRHSDEPKEATEGKIERWYDPVVRDDVTRANLVDVGTSASFFTQEMVGPTVWAVTYLASVKGETGDVWKKVVTIENAVKESGES